MTKWKIGQKYKVIKDSNFSWYNGRIVTVEKLDGDGFIGNDNRYYNIFDVLQLIKDKKVKGVSKNPNYKYTREEIIAKIDNSEIGWYTSDEIREDLVKILEEPKKFWTCSCGTVNDRNYCPNCLNKEPKKDCNCWRQLSSTAMKGEHGEYCNLKKESKEIEKITGWCIDGSQYQQVVVKLNELVEQVNKLSKEK